MRSALKWNGGALGGTALRLVRTGLAAMATATSKDRILKISLTFVERNALDFQFVHIKVTEDFLANN